MSQQNKIELINQGYSELKKTNKYYTELLLICGSTKFDLMSEEMQDRVINFLKSKNLIK